MWALVFSVGAVTMAGISQAGSTGAVTAKGAAKPVAMPLVVVEPPMPLPGKGLAQHDFIFTGEFDTRKPMATISLIQGGKRTWMYQIPTKDESNGQLSEFSDLHRLSNGDIVFAYKTGWRKIDKDGKMLYDFKCPQETLADGAKYYRECHTAQPIGQDKVMFMLNGCPARLCLYDLKAGKMEMEHVMRTKSPDDPKSVHSQFRNVRMTKAGTYLIAHMDLGKVIEYDKDWKEIWSCDAPAVWHAVRLKNGNTLVSGNHNAFAREIDKDGKIVWEYEDGDTPGIQLFGVHEVIRLANGNTVLTNWCPGRLGNRKEEWAKTIQLVEVTLDKKVVWVLREWADPDLGTSSCVQMLDEPGKDEEQELMR